MNPYTVPDQSFTLVGVCIYAFNGIIPPHHLVDAGLLKNQASSARMISNIIHGGAFDNLLAVFFKQSLGISTFSSSG